MYAGLLVNKPIIRNGEDLLRTMMLRIQVHLRRHQFLKELDPEIHADCELIQWSNGSKYCSSDVESLITFRESPQCGLEVRVRGPKNFEKECFFFLEEILSVVDQVNRIYIGMFTCKLILFTTGHA